MRLCRFDKDRLGVVQGDQVLDVTGALSEIPGQRWPVAQGDPLIANLKRVLAAAKKLAPKAKKKPLAKVKLLSPVPNPSKIIGAPINYNDHVAESIKDPGIAHGRTNIQKGIGEWGLFLKANSSLIGFGEEIRLRWPDRRNDHEVELAVVIGTRVRNIQPAEAPAAIAGYCIGLDMTIRGPEERSFRKSPDSYCVLGPWLATADEVPDPGALSISISVNGETRQDAHTSDLIVGVPELVAWASTFYTLHPGDVLLTGTPQGVGPVRPGDVMEAKLERVGSMRVAVSAA